MVLESGSEFLPWPDAGIGLNEVLMEKAGDKRRMVGGQHSPCRMGPSQTVQGPVVHAITLSAVIVEFRFDGAGESADRVRVLFFGVKGGLLRFASFSDGAGKQGGGSFCDFRRQFGCQVHRMALRAGVTAPHSDPEPDPPREAPTYREQTTDSASGRTKSKRHSCRSVPESA